MNLAINGGPPLSSVPLRFDWPVIDKSVEQAIIKQLHESISIYDDSGIFQKFEADFAKHHRMPIRATRQFWNVRPAECVL